MADFRNASQDLGFGTRAIHAGQRPDPTTGAIMTPVYQTSTYVQPELGRHLGYEYARTHNPTREALEGNLASLEMGKHGISFASGLAATDTLIKLFSAGDHIVCGENVYGGTYRLFNQVIARMGIEFSFVDSSSLDAIFVTTAMRCSGVDLRNVVPFICRERSSTARRPSCHAFT